MFDDAIFVFSSTQFKLFLNIQITFFLNKHVYPITIPLYIIETCLDLKTCIMMCRVGEYYFVTVHEFKKLHLAAPTGTSINFGNID